MAAVNYYDLGRSRAEQSSKQLIILAILFSLLLHLAFVSAVPQLFVATDQSETAPVDRILKVKFPQLDQTQPKGQIVDIMDNRASEKTPPKDSKFLSTKNRTVQDQTQARNTGPKPQASAGSQAQNQKSTSQDLADLGRKTIPENPKLKLPQSYLEKTTPDSGKVAALAPSNYLPEISMGDETLLNTREYTYASYFVRMKRQMENVWNPRSVLSRGNLLRSQYITTVRIVLFEDGRVAQVSLIRSSGNDALDREAVDTVRKAAPYLNPPNGLVDVDGRIRIPTWNFIVSMNALF